MMDAVFQPTPNQEKLLWFIGLAAADPLYSQQESFQGDVVGRWRTKFEEEWKEAERKRKGAENRERLLESMTVPGELAGGENEALALIDRCLRRDALWVYDNLHNPKVKAKDAPSPGAWGMRESYKSEPASFFKTILPKVMSSVATTADKDGLELEIQRREKKEIGRLKELLREAVEKSQEI